MTAISSAGSLENICYLDNQAQSSCRSIRRLSGMARVRQFTTDICAASVRCGKTLSTSSCCRS